MKKKCKISTNVFPTLTHTHSSSWWKQRLGVLSCASAAELILISAAVIEQTCKSENENESFSAVDLKQTIK